MTGEKSPVITNKSQPMKYTLLSLFVALMTGCVHAHQDAPAVTTTALTGHLADAQSSVTSAQNYLSPNDGKAAVIKQWLNTH
jgi:hypothetical protein